MKKMKFFSGVLLIIVLFLLLYSCSNSNLNSPPEITKIGHSYITVDYDRPFPTFIWVEVTDPDGLSDIEEVYVTQSISNNSAIYSFTLNDNGVEGDEQAGDGKYSYRMENEYRYYLDNEGHTWTAYATDSQNNTDTHIWEIQY